VETGSQFRGTVPRYSARLCGVTKTCADKCCSISSFEDRTITLKKRISTCESFAHIRKIMSPAICVSVSDGGGLFRGALPGLHMRWDSPIPSYTEPWWIQQTQWANYSTPREICLTYNILQQEGYTKSMFYGRLSAIFIAAENLRCRAVVIGRKALALLPHREQKLTLPRRDEL
jgi:hypothetical protein